MQDVRFFAFSCSEGSQLSFLECDLNFGRTTLSGSFKNFSMLVYLELISGLIPPPPKILWRNGARKTKIYREVYIAIRLTATTLTANHTASWKDFTKRYIRKKIKSFISNKSHLSLNHVTIAVQKRSCQKEYPIFGTKTWL